MTAMEERIWHRNYDSRISKVLNSLEISVVKLLDSAAEKYPKRDALIFMGKKITYNKILKLSNQFAHSLARLRVKRRQGCALSS
jgi:long-chain acyl-CoA synthetase